MALHKGTSKIANKSMSLSLRDQSGTVAEMCIRGHESDQDDWEEEEESTPRRPVKPRGGKKKNKPGNKPTKPATPTGGKGGRFEDVEGAVGPNKLKRKRGGNPEGDQCKFIAAGEACPFKTCSYSHKKTKKAKTGDK